MNLRKLFPILSLALLPFASNAQCEFAERESGVEYITRAIGPTPSKHQWTIAVGHNSDKYYLLTYVVQDGKRLPRMTENDLMILEFTNGEKLALHPIGEVPVNFNTTGSVSTTTNLVRIEISKETMQKLSTTDLKNVTAVIDNRDITRDAIDGQAPDIREAATCVLNKRG